MKRSRFLLSAIGLAFAAWIGYLVYLTRQIERPPIVLSRPQFLVADVVVVGHVKNKNGPVTVSEALIGANPGNAVPVGAEIQVGNLHNSWHRWINDGGPDEWELPGEFIIPLRIVDGKGDKWSAEVAPLPPPLGPRVYPVTPGTMEQLRAIIKSR
jgi:hypothetical protein